MISNKKPMTAAVSTTATTRAETTARLRTSKSLPVEAAAWSATKTNNSSSNNNNNNNRSGNVLSSVIIINSRRRRSSRSSSSSSNTTTTNNNKQQQQRQLQKKTASSLVSSCYANSRYYNCKHLWLFFDLLNTYNKSLPSISIKINTCKIVQRAVLQETNVPRGLESCKAQGFG